MAGTRAGVPGALPGDPADRHGDLDVDDREHNPGFLRRHPEARWLAALALVAALVAGVGTAVSGVLRSRSGLVITSPEALVQALRNPRVAGWSGSAYTAASTGLPHAVVRQLGDAMPVAPLLASPHTVRYWYGGPGRERVAVVQPRSEQDVVHTGSTVWLWDTFTRVARRAELSDPTAAVPLGLGTPATLAPPVLARSLLDEVGGASDLALRSGPDLAPDRETYELVLRPDHSASLIDEVDVDVDGQYGVPLGVRIYAAGRSAPVLDSTFSSVWFHRPSRRNFRFRPPPGAQVVTGRPLGLLTSDTQGVTVTGSGWQRVLLFPPDRARAALVRRVAAGRGRTLRGPWGEARVVEGDFFAAAVTPSGRVAFGAVSPARLAAALPVVPRPSPSSTSRPKPSSPTSAHAGPRRGSRSRRPSGNR